MSDKSLQEPFTEANIADSTVKILGEHHTHNKFVSYIAQKLSKESYDAICIESCPERFTTTTTKSTESIDIATEWAKINDIPLYLIDMPQSKIATQLSFIRFDKSQHSFPSEVIETTESEEAKILVDYNKLLKYQMDTAEKHPEYWDLFWEKRTQYMADKIENIGSQEEYENILVIVGLGHQQRLRIELTKRDNSYQPETQETIDPVSFD